MITSRFTLLLLFLMGAIAFLLFPSRVSAQVYVAPEYGPFTRPANANGATYERTYNVNAPVPRNVPPPVVEERRTSMTAGFDGSVGMPAPSPDTYRVCDYGQSPYLNGNGLGGFNPPYGSGYGGNGNGYALAPYANGNGGGQPYGLVPYANGNGNGNGYGIPYTNGNGNGNGNGYAVPTSWDRPDFRGFIETPDFRGGLQRGWNGTSGFLDTPGFSGQFQSGPDLWARQPPPVVDEYQIRGGFRLYRQPIFAPRPGLRVRVNVGGPWGGGFSGGFDLRRPHIHLPGGGIQFQGGFQGGGGFGAVPLPYGGGFGGGFGGGLSTGFSGGFGRG